MTKIYLIRHAEAEGNLYRRIQGQYDSLVTPRGMRQIEALAQRFKEIPIDAVYSSDMKRTQITASAITKYKNLPIQTTADLREVCLGVWEDMPWGNLEQTDPELLYNFNNSPRNFIAPGCEPFDTLQARLYGAVARVAARHEGQTAAVFSHGMAIRALLAKLKGIEPENIGSIPHADNTAVTLLHWDGSGFEIIFENDNSHLCGENSTLAQQSWWKNKSGLDIGNLSLIPMDLTADAALYERCYRETWRAAHGSLEGFQPGLYLQMARRHAKLDPRCVVKALSGETFVGLVELDPERGKNEGLGWISLCHIEKSHRGRGLGVQLIGHAVSVMRSLGRSRLGLSVAEENESAIRFYKRHGFVQTGVAQGVIGLLHIMEMEI